jgi:chromosome segregation ATPase
MNEEIARSALVMNNAQTKIRNLEDTVHSLQVELQRLTEQLAVSRREPEISQQISSDGNQRTRDLELRITELLEQNEGLSAKLRAEKTGIEESAREEELVKTIAALEMQLVETRDAVEEERKRNETLMNRLNTEIPTNTKRSLLSCFRPRV